MCFFITLTVALCSFWMLLLGTPFLANCDQILIKFSLILHHFCALFDAITFDLTIFRASRDDDHKLGSSSFCWSFFHRFCIIFARFLMQSPSTWRFSVLHERTTTNCGRHHLKCNEKSLILACSLMQSPSAYPFFWRSISARISTKNHRLWRAFWCNYLRRVDFWRLRTRSFRS